MRKFGSLALLLVVLLSTFALASSTVVAESLVHEEIIVVYAIPPQDDSMSNSHYALLPYHWYTTINYWINPKNKYGFSTSAVVAAITMSAETWDAETSFEVFVYKGTTTRTAGKRDGYNVVSWGAYQAGVIAVTYIWASGSQIVETDCRMNTYYVWSLTGEAGKMDVQNIMTHEFGHWCGLKDLYNDADYWLTMYGYANFGETYKRTLGLGDILGLQAVYGP
ncbi:MAG: hypothetical protein QXX51_03030 [Candidatus Bathyarchaeia archaeon]